MIRIRLLAVPAAILAAVFAACAAAGVPPDSLSLLAVADLAPHPFAPAHRLPALPAVTLRLEGATALEPAARAAATGRITGAFDFDGLATPARLELGATRAPGMLRGEVRALAGRALGAWAGVAVQRRGETTQPLLGLGGWARRRSVLFGASVSRFEGVRTVRHVTVIDTIALERVELDAIMHTAARASARWAGGPVELDVGGGVALGRAAPWRWADARLTVWAWRPLGLVATASSPAPLTFEGPASAGHRASLGFKLDPWRAAAVARPKPPLEWKLRRTAPGWYAVEMRAQGAQTVELMGDVTGWNPRPLQRESADRWRLEMALPAGVHRIAVRLDGGDWRPPPGLPTALDEFGGVVGVLLVD